MDKDNTKFVLAIVFVGLLLLAQIVATILITAAWWRSDVRTRRADDLAERLAVTLTAPVNGFLVSLIHPEVYGFVTSLAPVWYLVSVGFILLLIYRAQPQEDL